jgi:hypothetical protein
LDDKKSRHAGFAQQNGFGLSFLHMMLLPVKDTAKFNTCCWSCCWLARTFDWSRWVAISSLQSLCSPSFSFKSEVGKKRTTQLGNEKSYLQGHILSSIGYAHSPIVTQ